ncbi:hypothetical protein QBC47DRAFT_431143 [Echria macrotheca]|uniref:Ankyrin repeat protein n=1 Tax=Echria macrotheca TaxID=438768 RepID=A0AAJ0F433_9PEZI|nr:hypothetical protein QBC47DRAFT_431143 [Echria macrotheca]
MAILGEPDIAHYRPNRRTYMDTHYIRNGRIPPIYDQIHTGDYTLKATLLYFAARNCNVEVVDWLLRHGADPDAGSEGSEIQYWENAPDRPENTWKWSPLMAAVWNGHLDVIECLMRNGASFSTDAVSMIAFRGHVHLLDWVSSHTADFSAGDSHCGATPLFYAALRWDNHEMITRLVGLGARFKMGHVERQPVDIPFRSIKPEVPMGDDGSPAAQVELWNLLALDPMAAALRRKDFGTALCLIRSAACTGFTNLGLRTVVLAAIDPDNSLLTVYGGEEMRLLPRYKPPKSYRRSEKSREQRMRLLRHVCDNAMPDIDTLISWHGSPLLTALKVNKITRGEAGEMARYLLERGANPDFAPKRLRREYWDQDESTIHQPPIIQALYNDLCTWALCPDARAQLKPHQYWYLVSAAAPRTSKKKKAEAAAGPLSLVKLLVAHGANLAAQSWRGLTVLEHLCTEVERWLEAIALPYLRLCRRKREHAEDLDTDFVVLQCRAVIETLRAVMEMAEAGSHFPAELLASYRAQAETYEGPIGDWKSQSGAPTEASFSEPEGAEGLNRPAAILIHDGRDGRGGGGGWGALLTCSNSDL